MLEDHPGPARELWRGDYWQALDCPVDGPCVEALGEYDEDDRLVRYSLRSEESAKLGARLLDECDLETKR